MEYTIEIRSAYPDAPKQVEWHWRLVAPNGQPVCCGNDYLSRASAKRGARNVVLAMCTKPIIIEEWSK